MELPVSGTSATEQAVQLTPPYWQAAAPLPVKISKDRACAIITIFLNVNQKSDVVPDLHALAGCFFPPCSVNPQLLDIGGRVGRDNSEELEGAAEVTVLVHRIVLLGFVLVGPPGPLSLLSITLLLLLLLPMVIARVFLAYQNSRSGSSP